MDAVVSPMSEREFGTVFAKLAIQLRWHDADEVAIRSYFDVLKAFPLHFIKAAADTLARERGRKFFPTTGEWRDAIEVIWKDAEQSTNSQPRDWKVECEECDDCGWQHYECTGDHFCGRPNKHLPHTFVRVCACRATNRTYQRHHGTSAGSFA